jgi:TRAP-type C4-dicarboxylate transport system permease small subunit
LSNFTGTEQEGLIGNDETLIYKGDKRAMEKMKLWKRIGSFILNFFEIYLSSTVFFLLFVVFLLQIFYRYFLVPLTWPLEFTLMAFIWVTLLGACFAQRDYSHVKFALIYDSKNPRTQTWMRVIGNALVFIAFSIALYPSYRYVIFMSFKKSNVLKIPMSVAFSPFIIFLIIIIGRLGYDLYIDIKKLLRGEF